tara:strand:- start:3141 stop:3302 length:162 start_codon:yes stop_codon:yes gene_type:complete
MKKLYFLILQMAFLISSESIRADEHGEKKEVVEEKTEETSEEKKEKTAEEKKE